VQRSPDAQDTAFRQPGARHRAGTRLRWIAVVVVVCVVVGVGLGIYLATRPAATASGPTPTVQDQTPRGANELAWSEAILTKLGDPLTAANIQSMGYWMQNEAGTPPTGIVGANNPINVSQPGFGGSPIKAEGGGYYLYSYPTVQDGVDATAAYLNRQVYAGILGALKAGSGLSSSSLSQEFSVYSGNGYSTIPDSWGASQGQPPT
jgi:hypothetical protein